MSSLASTVFKSRIATSAALVIIGLGVFVAGDWIYDWKMMDANAAIETCGQGNVQKISVEGFYKREITCFTDLTPAT